MAQRWEMAKDSKGIDKALIYKAGEGWKRPWQKLARTNFCVRVTEEIALF